jgi:bifunctional UDP-N-acetylglucosamine pyrophosphorylase/glucosamine-1-phosphate N-acetyltransferase
VVGARSTVEQTTARDAEIGADAHVGPYAHIAPGESVPDGTQTGPFYALPHPPPA